MVDHILQRLDFAEKRMIELLRLNGGNLVAANESYRQQLVQEFFFHLVGAIDMLAQFVNEKRGLGIDLETVTTSRVVNQIPATDVLKVKLGALYTNTRSHPLPLNPYSDDGYLFRIYNYRNQVAHRGRNPWNFVMTGSQPASITLQLDPRGPNRVGSTKTVQDELRYMLDLVRNRCREVLDLL